MPQRPESNDERNDKWKLDKHIPVALLLTILLQTGCGFWWAASISQKVVYLELAVGKDSGLDSRLAVVESKLDMIRSQLMGKNNDRNSN